MLNRHEKADLVWAAMGLETLAYNFQDMWLLFEQWAKKTPEQINAMLEFLRTNSNMTFKLYCEITIFYRDMYLKVLNIASKRQKAITFKI